MVLIVLKNPKPSLVTDGATAGSWDIVELKGTILAMLQQKGGDPALSVTMAQGAAGTGRLDKRTMERGACRVVFPKP